MYTFITPLFLLAVLGAAPGEPATAGPVSKPDTSKASSHDKAPPVPGQMEKGKGTKGQGHFTVGKETTYVTGPLDKDGYVDYAAALNERLGRGVTPENNANVLLWKAFGPHPENSTAPPEFFRLLGIPAPPEDGRYFIDLSRFLKKEFKIDTAKEREPYFSQLEKAWKRPWTDRDYPALASWLKANDKSLALVIEASQRPNYFSPIVPRKTEQGSSGLVGVPLPAVQKCRDLTKALAARAMLRAGSGDFDGAWQDLLACHRLGRQVGRGSSLIEGLVGLAIDGIACQAELGFLEKARSDSKRLESCQHELQSLPPLPSMADKVDLAERFMYLDTIMMLDRQGAKFLEGMAGGAFGDIRPLAEFLLYNMDWDPTLRLGNKWYDRLAAALREKDLGQRNKKLDEMEAELKDLRVNATERWGMAQMVLGGAKYRSQVMGEILISLLVPAIRKAGSAAERNRQVEDNTILAFALARYQDDHGDYPKELGALVPRYLERVPKDRFSGKALVYHPAEGGYLLYSVGVNGKDEEGRGFGDEPQGDDLSVRMPLPKLRQN